MPSRFLTGRNDGGLVWACVDEQSLCIAPLVSERRFAAYLAPFQNEPEARQALLEAGAGPETIGPEQRSARRRGRR